jgi:hypothetical protein
MHTAFIAAKAYSCSSDSKPESITQNKMTNKIDAIIMAIIALRQIIGFSGADVAWPISTESGVFTPNGKVIKNTHHHNRIKTTIPETTPI